MYNILINRSEIVPGNAMSVTLTFQLLGGLTISREGRPVSGFHSRKEEALLAYLAVTGRPHTRLFLAGLFWGDLPESRALANLRRALTHLRAVAGEHLRITRQVVEFERESDYWLDVEVFEEQVCKSASWQVGKVACGRVGEYASTRVRELGEAVTLCRGDFLAGFYVKGCPAFEEWVFGERERLRRLAIETLRTLIAVHRVRGEYPAAIAYAHRLLALDLWLEETHRELMLLLALSGQRTAALAQYEQCRRLLAEELGLEPLEETRALYERLVDWEAGKLVDRETGKLVGRETVKLVIREAGKLVDWETGKLVDWETGKLVNRATNPPIYQFTNLPIPQFTNLPIYQSTDLPFVGRGEEHARLLSVWEQVRKGQGKLTLIAGEAGAGKTRLVEEVTRYAKVQGAVTLSGRCYEFGDSVPYQSIATALRSGLSEGAGEPGRRGARVRGSKGDSPPSPALLHPCSPAPLLPCALSPIWLAELSRLLPELRENHPDLPAPIQVSGEAARQRLFEAVARFLCSFSNFPIILFLDDLHWAARPTLDLLHYLTRQVAAEPVWILGTYRPEEADLDHPLTRLRQGLSRDRLVHHLGLKPLTPGAVGALTHALVGDEQEHTSLETFLYRESEGNPFILVETIANLREEGALQWGEGGNWLWRGLPERSALLRSVRDIVLQRVGRLSKPARQYLNLAAVIGRQFDISLLETAAGQDAAAVDEALTEWLERRLVRSVIRNQGAGIRNQSPVISDHWLVNSGYDFSHDKIRAVVYHEISAPRRRVLHRRVGEAFEKLYADRLETVSAALAYHFEQAGATDKALTYLPMAATQAASVYANQEALEYYDRALRLTPAADELRWDILLRQAEIMRLIGWHDQTIEVCKQVLDGGDELWQARAANILSESYRARRDYEQARFYACESNRLMILAEADTETGAPKEQARAMQALGLVEREQGNLDEAQALFEKARALYTASDTPHGAAEALVGLGKVYADRGQHDIARQQFEEAMAVFISLEDRQREAACLRDIGMTHWREGANAAASQVFDKSLSICQEIGDREGEAGSLNGLGLVLITQGAHDETRRYWEESVAIFRELGLEKRVAFGLHNLGILHMSQGYCSDAQQCLEESLTINQAAGAKPSQALDMGWLGKLALHFGEYQAALKYLDAALELDREIGGSTEQDMHLIWRGVAAYETGDLDGALGYIQRAIQSLEGTRVRLKTHEVYRELSQVYLARGEGEKALDAAREALRHAEVIGDGNTLGFALANLGAVCASSLITDAPDPRPYFERGLALLQDGVPASLWHGQALREYGAHLIQCGELNQGEAYLHEARTIFERLGAQGELAKVEAFWNLA
ncbi:MAG: tetratricopeptide repeat protein [Chloroflexi bacterium]|nr:tetratricopeptide repeat protein [Chloroflexota bacterium]